MCRLERQFRQKSLQPCDATGGVGSPYSAPRGPMTLILCVFHGVLPDHLAIELSANLTAKRP